MDVSLLLTIQALVSMVVGVAFVVIPRQWSAPFGMRLDDGAVFFARLTGAAFIGLGVINWFARGQAGEVIEGVILGNLVAQAISAVVHLRAMMTGLHNRTGWGTFALVTALALAWLVAWIA